MSSALDERAAGIRDFELTGRCTKRVHNARQQKEKRACMEAQRRLPPNRCPFKDGQHFNCRPLRYQPVVRREDFAHNSTLHAERRIARTHPGDRVLCLELLTKDDWPLLRSWVLHHGYLVGFEHLYIFDGSTQPEIITFLKHARDVLGVNVLFTKAGLNDVEKELQSVMGQLAARDACDFMAKLDTDELLDTFKGSPEASLARVATRADFQQVLNALSVDGRSYVVPWAAASVPKPIEASTCLDPEYDVSRSSEYFVVTPWKVPFGDKQRFVKTFASSSTFAQVDLGSHDFFGNMAMQPWGKRPKIEASLMAYHFHLTCYERAIQRDEVAALSHGYFDRSDNASTRAQKARFYARRPNLVSLHKVRRYWASLEDPVGSKRAYHAHFSSSAPRMLAFSEHITRLMHNSSRLVVAG